MTAIDLGQRLVIHDLLKLIATRNRPMLKALEICIEQFEQLNRLNEATKTSSALSDALVGRRKWSGASNHG